MHCSQCTTSGAKCTLQKCGTLSFENCLAAAVSGVFFHLSVCWLHYICVSATAFIKCSCILFYRGIRYGDGVRNTIEENSSIFSLIQVKCIICQQNPPVLNWWCPLTQFVLCSCSSIIVDRQLFGWLIVPKARWTLLTCYMLDVNVHLHNSALLHFLKSVCAAVWCDIIWYDRQTFTGTLDFKLECGSMPSVMAALPNTGGALCSAPQSLADVHCWSTVQ